MTRAMLLLLGCLGTVDAGAYYLFEQPVFDHDKEHKRVRIWPRTTLVHKLRFPK